MMCRKACGFDSHLSHMDKDIIYIRRLTELDAPDRSGPYMCIIVTQKMDGISEWYKVLYYERATKTWWQEDESREWNPPTYWLQQKVS